MADDFFGRFAQLIALPSVAEAQPEAISVEMAAPGPLPLPVAADKTISPARQSWLGWGAVALIVIIAIAILWTRLG
jgi:hypothetical protein